MVDVLVCGFLFCCCCGCGGGYVGGAAAGGVVLVVVYRIRDLNPARPSTTNNTYLFRVLQFLARK